jgi:hypothetical protein
MWWLHSEGRILSAKKTMMSWVILYLGCRNRLLINMLTCYGEGSMCKYICDHNIKFCMPVNYSLVVAET